MSFWVSPTHPAPSPIPLGALRGGDGAGRWAGRMGARLRTEWMVLRGGVDLKAVTEGSCHLCERASSLFLHVPQVLFGANLVLAT